jgi:hypothetical protein
MCMSRVKNKSTDLDKVSQRLSFSAVYQENLYVKNKFRKFKTKFRTKCFDTNKVLPIGTMVLFDTLSRRVFSLESPTYAYAISNNY